MQALYMGFRLLNLNPIFVCLFVLFLPKSNSRVLIPFQFRMVDLIIEAQVKLATNRIVWRRRWTLCCSSSVFSFSRCGSNATVGRRTRGNRSAVSLTKAMWRESSSGAVCNRASSAGTLTTRPKEKSAVMFDCSFFFFFKKKKKNHSYPPIRENLAWVANTSIES